MVLPQTYNEDDLPQMRDEDPLPYDEYLVWPRKGLDADAEDALGRQIQDVVGPDVKVTRETSQSDVPGVRRVMFWEVMEPSEEHLRQLELLDGVKCLQKNEIDED